jgi:hypothetical protein
MNRYEHAFERDWKQFLKGYDKYVKEHHNRFMVWLLKRDIPEHEKYLAKLFFMNGILLKKRGEKS